MHLLCFIPQGSNGIVNASNVHAVIEVQSLEMKQLEISNNRIHA